MNASKPNRWLALGTNAGVLAGILLLAYEVHQNANLTRAQMTMDRTIATTQILSEMANGGEIIRIDVKLREQDDFPRVPGWSRTLTAEEKRRYEFWMLLRLVELNNEWYLCAEKLMPVQICQRDVRANMRTSLSRFHELGISFKRSEPSFIAAMQEYALELGLSDIGDDGAWQPDPN